jgi:3-methyladenine DNA glycosylase AlkD
MTANDILNEIKPLGSENYKRVMMKHGVKEPFFGVKISDLQKIVKRIKVDYQLALDLYDTGNYDAMYLAGLIADDPKMTKKDLKKWVSRAYCRGLAAWTVPWVASGSKCGFELAIEWMDSKKELMAVAGWGTLSSLVSVKPDSELDLKAMLKLLQRVEKGILKEPDLVRYQMNSFLIAVGSYVEPLSQKAIEIAAKLGPLSIDLGDNDCKVPYAPDYIAKVQKRGAIGKKRKSAKC